MDKTKEKEGGERIAKVMARAGLCSRRDAEAWIVNGRVSLNGRILTSAAINVGKSDVILVDGKPLPKQDITRVWLYYKPKGLVTTAHDPEGRPTAFERLPPEMPRVISVGRLDLNSEGLLVLTNDGELARRLELPATGWIRRYRVRVNGRIDPQLLDFRGVCKVPAERRHQHGGHQQLLDADPLDAHGRELSTSQPMMQEVFP